MKNPYETLGVDKNADKETIDKAYRERAKELHPDMGGDAESFDEIGRAVAVLRDPRKRKHFDQTGHIDENPVDNLRAAAIQCIESFIGAKLNGWDGGADQDPRTMDMVKMMKAHFTDEINTGRQSVKIQNDLHIRTRDVGRRFKTDNPENVIKRLFDNRLRQIEGNIEEVKRLMEVRRLAIELINEYDFQFDKPDDHSPFVNVAIWGFPPVGT